MHPFTSVSVLVSGVVSPDGKFVLDILIEIVELFHVVVFQSSAVLWHVNNVEKSVSLHGLEEEGVDVGVVVQEVLVGDLGYSGENAMFLLGPESVLGREVLKEGSGFDVIRVLIA